MATYSSHSDYNGGNLLSTLPQHFFDWIFIILAGNEYNYKIRNSASAEIAALERLENPHRRIMGEMLCAL